MPISLLPGKKKTYLFLASCLFVFSCQKSDTIIIPNNIAPPDSTISDVAIQNYINKLYISILGREADSLEYTSALNILTKNNVSKDNKKELIDIVLNKPSYYNRIYKIARTNLLNDLDTADISLYISIFNTTLQDTTKREFWEQTEAEKARLEKMQEIESGLQSNQFDIIEMYKRCIDNFFYDQLNMGTENFVVSIFQHFLSRYPTENELSSGKKMVDGQTSIFFLESGRSKQEFIHIFFSHTEFYEGQVRELFKRYLFREPNSYEMNAYSILFKTSDYKNLQKEILLSDEYFGTGS